MSERAIVSRRTTPPKADGDILLVDTSRASEWGSGSGHDNNAIFSHWILLSFTLPVCTRGGLDHFGATQLPEPVRQTLHKSPVDIHHVNILLAGAIRTESDEVTVRTEVWVFVVSLRFRKSLNISAVRIHDEDIEAFVDPACEGDFVVLCRPAWSCVVTTGVGETLDSAAVRVHTEDHGNACARRDESKCFAIRTPGRIDVKTKGACDLVTVLVAGSSVKISGFPRKLMVSAIFLARRTDGIISGTAVDPFAVGKQADCCRVEVKLI